MYRRAMLTIIVYVLFNLATLHASPDPILEKMSTELEKCRKDLATLGGKDKICNNITDLETRIQTFKDYLSTTHGNRTVNENVKYMETIKNAIADKHFTNVTRNQKCIDVTALKNCKAKQYEAPGDTPLMKKYFSKNYNISPKRSACSNSKKLNACILSDAINKCDNETIGFFKDRMDERLKECLDIVEDSNIESTSDAPDGTARYLQTLRSISIAFFALILL